MAYAKFKTEVADKEFPGIENMSNENFWQQMTRTKKRFSEYKRGDGNSNVEQYILRDKENGPLKKEKKEWSGFEDGKFLEAIR